MKATIRSRNSAYRFIDAACNTLGERFEKPHKIEITEVKPTRSLEQNSYLFGVVYKTILDHNLREQGWTAEDVHEFYCGEHFGWKPLDGLGRTRLKPIRTTTTDIYGKRSVLTKMEFSDFIAYIQQKSAENGIFIPDPEEQ